jgi:DNA-binding NtrC family response regulator
LENVIRRLLVLRCADTIAEEIRAGARRREKPAPVRTVERNRQVVVLPEPPAAPENALARAAGRGAAPASDTPAWLRDAAPDDARFMSMRRMRASDAAASLDNEQWSVLERVDQARRAAETDAILTALHSTLWNRKQAAALLNLDYKALLYKMKKLGITDRARVAI